MTKLFSDPDAIADAIIAGVGTNLVVGLPLGLGKANHIVNALFRRASADPSISLTLFSALTLEKPRASSELEKRFIGPVIERLFGGYPDLDYATALHRGMLPDNIEVFEFFFLAGKWMHAPYAQQHYISANYTHAASYLMTRGVNVITQLVAKRVEDGVTRYSLSCNADLTLDLLRARDEGRASFKLVGQVNSELPFMSGLGDLPAQEFSAVLDSADTDFPLFAPPSEPVSDTKYAIGLHAATLVRDGGTLQIGIGQIGDALAQGLVLRHRDNAGFRGVMQRLAPDAPLAADVGPFAQGLYGVSEMLFEAFLALIDAGILKREVDGVVLHGAFFLGPQSFYKALREMSSEQLAKIQMMPVSFTNELYGDEAAKRSARVDARFINNAMIATLMGAAISDGLEDGQVVSGVGGQYNFVAQAFALEGARSILTVESTRAGRKPASNIRWRYGHTTIPRHLRDIIITEYGVADLRGKSDADVIAAMLAVADSRFQPELMKLAKDAGKLQGGYQVSSAHRDNTPARIAAALKPARDAGLLPMFPFGSDFTEAEQRLIPALQVLKEALATPMTLARLLWRGFSGTPDAEDATCLARLGLATPATLKDRVYRALVSGALASSKTRPSS
jgi:hypothetical protein